MGKKVKDSPKGSSPKEKEKSSTPPSLKLNSPFTDFSSAIIKPI
jgi:hypothetical protein